MNFTPPTSKKQSKYNPGSQPLIGYSLRPATEEDLPALETLEKSVHVSPWNQEHMKAEMEKPYAQFWVLTDDETDEKIAAYIVAWQMFDEGHILNVAVDPRFQRQGIAQFLVRRVVSAAYQKGIRKVLLDVRKSNTPAQALYQSIGFAVTHVRKGFYSDGEDGYAMALFMNEGEVIQF